MDKQIKKVVYTALIGGYKLNEPKYINKDWQLICFANRRVTSENWSIVHIKGNHNPRKLAREIKIRCDKYLDFDVCLWIDAKFTINYDLNMLLYQNFKRDIVVMGHNRRNCIYDEAKFCIDRGIGDRESILRQVRSYKKEGFPSNFGLYGTGILFRKNTTDVIKLMKAWYNEIEKYSLRDQISFPYALWKNPIELGITPFRDTYSAFK